MIHEELADWISNGWGWHYPIASTIQKVWPDRKKCKLYIQFLLGLYRKMKNNTGLSVMLNYSGFTDEFKNKLSSDYSAKL